MILLVGCAAKYTIISGTDLVSPVSVSPVVSTNGKEEKNKIDEFSGEAGYKYTWWGIGYSSGKKTIPWDNIQNNIIKATRGTAERSVNNLEFNIKYEQWIIYYIFGYYGEKKLNADVKGNIIKVK